MSSSCRRRHPSYTSPTPRLRLSRSCLATRHGETPTRVVALRRVSSCRRRSRSSCRPLAVARFDKALRRSLAVSSCRVWRRSYRRTLVVSSLVGDARTRAVVSRSASCYAVSCLVSCLVVVCRSERVASQLATATRRVVARSCPYTTKARHRRRATVASLVAVLGVQPPHSQPSVG